MLDRKKAIIKREMDIRSADPVTGFLLLDYQIRYRI